MPRATVLIPTWDAPDTIGAAIASARAQSMHEIEILVVSDGAKESTLAIARSHAAEDPRVRILDLPKGESRGERNRHEGVLAANAPNIVYLADDDLILPRHVELLVEALENHDLVQSRNAHISAKGELALWVADLGDSAWHAFHLSDPPQNRTSLTGTAHTLAAYRRIEDGWVVPAPGMPADFTLWRKFLRLPGVRAATLNDVTTLQFPANMTPSDPLEAAAHRAPWVALLERPDAHERLQEIAVRSAQRQLLAAELALRARHLRALQLDRELEATRLQHREALLEVESTRELLRRSRCSAQGRCLKSGR